MRIPLGKKDLPLLKKAVKIIRKASFHKSLKQMESLDQVAKALGYIDYKQLLRLTQLDKSYPVPSVTLNVIHAQLSDAIESYINPLSVSSDNYIHASSFIEKLNLKSLTTLNPEKPKLFIFDEYSQYHNYNNNNDNFIKIVENLGFPSNKWFLHNNPEDAVNDRSIIIHEKLSKALKSIITNDDDIHTLANLKTEKRLSQLKHKLEYDVIPEILISPHELIQDHNDLNVSPYGFNIISGNIDSTHIYALYNNSLKAFIPVVFKTLSSANQALCMLITQQGIQNIKKHKVDGNAVFPAIESTIKVHNGEMKESDDNHFLRTNNKVIGNLLNVLNFSKLSIDNVLNDNTIELPFTPPKQVLSYPSIPHFYGMSFIDVSAESQDRIGACSEFIGGIEQYSREQLSQETINSAINYIGDKIKAINYDESEYINVDDKDEFKEKFVNLLKIFPMNQISEWHDDYAESVGYRARGYIYASEIEVVSHILYGLLLKDNNIENKYSNYDYQLLPLVLFGFGLSGNDIIDKMNTLIKLKKKLCRDIDTINSAEYEAKRINNDEEIISAGDRVATFHDLCRSTRKHSIQVTQKLSDFSNDSLAKFELIHKFKNTEEEKKHFNQLRLGYQMTIMKLFESKEIEFYFDKPSHNYTLSEDEYRINCQFINDGLNSIGQDIKDFYMADLLNYLTENDPTFAYLKDNPHYFLCAKMINGKKYLYFTTYIEDSDECLDNNIDPGSLILRADIKLEKVPFTDISSIESNLARPDLSFNYLLMV